MIESFRPCPDCGGTGSIWKEKVQIPCSYCGGTGKAPRTYQSFLDAKTPRAQSAGFEPGALPAHLKDFQAAVVDFCIRQGRCGMYLDTGLGKTRCQLEWAHQSAEASNGRALILTPLAVARQFEAEALRLGYDARVIRDQSEAKAGINICNYDRLDKLDPEAFGAVSLDEASILKSFTGKTQQALTATFADHRFKCAATATPAPNDHMELGQQAAFLGIMPAFEMLMRWFINDTSTASQQWRLKGHAEEDFWDWLASWARMAQSPADLGFDDAGYILPALEIIRHRTVGDVKPQDGALFAADVSATTMHDMKRQTIAARADAAAAIVAAEPDEAWLIWTDTDYEADAVRAAISGTVEVRGSHSIDAKEERIGAFLNGEEKRLLSKPSICGYGLNAQHCARQIFVGRTFSYELWYQAVRRSWRFGQARPVHVHLIVAEGEDQIGRVIDRKADDHAKMKAAMAQAMRRAMHRSALTRAPYNPMHEGRLPAWLRSVA